MVEKIFVRGRNQRDTDKKAGESIFSGTAGAEKVYAERKKGSIPGSDAGRITTV